MRITYHSPRITAEYTERANGIIALGGPDATAYSAAICKAIHDEPDPMIAYDPRQGAAGVIVRTARMDTMEERDAHARRLLAIAITAIREAQQEEADERQGKRAAAAAASRRKWDTWRRTND